ncbi:swi5-dependent recombination DNA repair protein 1 homolog [Scylla paramamosain]|uniref:swi5-dependent recombination DNA repair protein 1 homolog n=1 Tax=Scylla paramamosain TaxID=85552 RepID=UPI0030829C0B
MWEKEKTHMQPQSLPASHSSNQPTSQQATRPPTHPASQPASQPTAQPTVQQASQPAVHPPVPPTSARQSHPLHDPRRRLRNQRYASQPTLTRPAQPRLGPYASTQQLTTAPTRPSPITRRRHPGNDRPPLEVGIEQRGDPGQSRSGRGCPSTGYEGERRDDADPTMHEGEETVLPSILRRTRKENEREETAGGEHKNAGILRERTPFKAFRELLLSQALRTPMSRLSMSRLQDKYFTEKLVLWRPLRCCGALEAAWGGGGGGVLGGGILLEFVLREEGKGEEGECRAVPSGAHCDTILRWEILGYF